MFYPELPQGFILFYCDSPEEEGRDEAPIKSINCVNTNTLTPTL